MDEIVKAALLKWPHVPHCWGWLALDARGEWYMRDERVQAAGAFPTVKGSRILHDKLREFIHRNYLCDDAGAWFFQNGPQRVYVELECTPWIWRLQALPGGAPEVVSHTGIAGGTPRSTWLDEADRLYLEMEAGLGLVHTLDIEVAADALEAGQWPAPQTVRAATLPQRFGFVRSPVAARSAPG